MNDDTLEKISALCIGIFALYCIWNALCWIWANIIAIMIGIGCLIGIGLLGILAWYFRKTLLLWLIVSLKFLGFLILAIPVLVFWEIPKWLYKRYKKI